MAIHVERDTRLLADQRQFDERVVRSTLEFYELLGPQMPERDTASVSPRSLIAPFHWLPPLMRQLVRREQATFRWDDTEDVPAMATAHWALTSLARSLAPDAIGIPPLARGHKPAGQRWLQSVLADLEIHSRYDWNGSTVTFTAIPLLTSVQQCVAYTLALMKRDAYELGRLVRPCPYLMRDENPWYPHHLFVAAQPNQYFCSRRHSNCQRQRDHRARKEALGAA